jgi:hypothetical protein
MQYAASVHAEKLKKMLHRAANRDRPAGQTIGKQYFNPRLVPEEVGSRRCPHQVSVPLLWRSQINRRLAGKKSCPLLACRCQTS